MKLPIGISDFKTVIEDKYIFVDKSLFIQDILYDSAKVILITRPRRFGKTINMSMLYYYLNNMDNTDKKQNLFDNLAIKKETELTKSYFLQYPTIFISLKSLKALTAKSAIKMFKIMIGDLYDRYGNILLSSNLTNREKNYVQAIINGTVSDEEIKLSLKNLIYYFYKIYNKKVFLLIDEYDAPIHSAYLNNYYDEIIDFIGSVLGEALKDSTYLEKGIVTGITRVAQASIFSEVNNLKVCSLLQDQYSQYFGFTEDEVIKLLHNSKIKTQLADIKHWYNGYTIGNNTIYNPWSILNCLDQNGNLTPYWVNTSSNDLIKQLINKSPVGTKEVFEKLLQRQEVACTIDEHMVFPSIKTNDNALWSLLLFSGYITMPDKKIGNDGKPYGPVVIPNKEITTLYISIIREWFTSGFNISSYHNLMSAFINYKPELIANYIQKYIMQSGSYFDFTKESNEQVYHVFILGLVAGLSDEYVINSNQESGLGLVDVILIPKDKTKAGIILEFKTAKDEHSLEQEAKLALQQIKHKEYLIKINQHGVKQVLLIGLAFCGKKLAMSHEII